MTTSLVHSSITGKLNCHLYLSDFPVSKCRIYVPLNPIQFCSCEFEVPSESAFSCGAEVVLMCKSCLVEDIPLVALDGGLVLVSA